jgi:hypothetical protein
MNKIIKKSLTIVILSLTINNITSAAPHKSDLDFYPIEPRDPIHTPPTPTPETKNQIPPLLITCDYTPFYKKHFKEHPHNIDSCNRLMTIETTKDNTYRNQLKLLLIKAKQTHTQR